jgi:hypothetical protein
MTNLTLGIGLQGKPNDYTGLYAKAYAQKAAGDAEQRKADKAALDAAMKDVEVDLERVHPALRDDYRQKVARIYDDIQGEFQKDPRGAISQVRRKMIDYQSGLNSYLTSSDALFAIEKLDPNKVNIPDDLVREFRNAQNFGTAGLMKFYEDNRARLEPFGISFGAPSAEGYAPEVAAMVVPRVDLEKNFQAIGNNLGIDFNQVVQEYQRGNKIWLEFARDNQQVRDAAISFFSDKINLRNAAIRGIDIFTDQGSLDPSKAAIWAANLLKGQVESVTRPSGGGFGGRQNRSVAFEGQGLQLFAFNTAYDVEAIQGISVPDKSMTITIGKGTITPSGEPLAASMFNIRRLSVNNLQTLMVYKGPDIEIDAGTIVPDGRGGFTTASEFTIKSGMPVPQAWLSSPEFSGLLRGNVYEQKFLVGKVDNPGTERGTLTTPEGGVYVPITDDIKGNLMATYSGDSGIEEFLRDITPKSVPIGGTSRPAGGTSRPAQPASNTPAPPPSGGTPGSGPIPPRPNGARTNSSVNQYLGK